MIKLSDGDTFEDERSLNQNLTFASLSEEMALRHLDFGLIQQKNLGLINQDDMYTNLALLVSDECRHSIKLAVFQGDDKSVFKDRKEFTGSIFKQLKEVCETIDFYNGTKANFDGLMRIDKRDYPAEAIREALLNAVIHRDYSFSGSIAINLYADRIEFISLGGLVSGLSLAAIMLGASQARNEKLASLFYRMKLIESYGIGISKILSAYKNHHIKPRFETTQGAFCVSLPHMNMFNHQGKRAKSYPELVHYMKEHAHMTRAEIEHLYGIKTTRANAIINELLELGVIEKIGKGKHTKYQLIQ